MTQQERDALAHFMRLVLCQMHPDYHNYPIPQMRAVENSEGESFEGTLYENSTTLIRAYYMGQAIETIERGAK